MRQVARWAGVPGCDPGEVTAAVAACGSRPHTPLAGGWHRRRRRSWRTTRHSAPQAKPATAASWTRDCMLGSLHCRCDDVRERGTRPSRPAARPGWAPRRSLRLTGRGPPDHYPPDHYPPSPASCAGSGRGIPSHALRRAAETRVARASRRADAALFPHGVFAAKDLVQRRHGHVVLRHEVCRFVRLGAVVGACTRAEEKAWEAGPTLVGGPVARWNPGGRSVARTLPGWHIPWPGMPPPVGPSSSPELDEAGSKSSSCAGGGAGGACVGRVSERTPRPRRRPPEEQRARIGVRLRPSPLPRRRRASRAKHRPGLRVCARLRWRRRRPLTPRRPRPPAGHRCLHRSPPRGSPRGCPFAWHTLREYDEQGWRLLSRPGFSCEGPGTIHDAGRGREGPSPRPAHRARPGPATVIPQRARLPPRRLPSLSQATLLHALPNPAHTASHSMGPASSRGSMPNSCTLPSLLCTTMSKVADVPPARASSSARISVRGMKMAGCRAGIQAWQFASVKRMHAAARETGRESAKAVPCPGQWRREPASPASEKSIIPLLLGWGFTHVTHTDRISQASHSCPRPSKQPSRTDSRKQIPAGIGKMVPDLALT